MPTVPGRSARVCNWIAAIVVSVAAGPAAFGAATADGLLAASSDEHLWFLIDVPKPRNGKQLCHHELDMDGPEYEPAREVQTFTPEPQALAAWGERVWIILQPDRHLAQPTRSVFTVSMRRNVLVGGYDFVPSDRLEVGAPLPGHGRLAGVAGTSQGLVALILPAQWASAGVRGPEESAASASEPDSPALLQLRHDGWSGIDLPADFDRNLTWRLAAGGPEGRTIWLVGSGSAPRLPAVVYRSDGGTWTQSIVPIESSSIRSLTRIGSQVTAIMDGFSPGMIEAAILRPTKALPLAEWPEPSGHWSVLGMRDGLRVIRQTPSTLTMSRIDWPTGSAGSIETMTQHKPRIGQVIHIPVLLAAGLAAMLAALVLRPSDEASKVTLPPKMALVQPGARLMALAIDLLPAGVLAVLLLDCPPGRLLQAPIFAARFDDALPSFLMIALTFVHSTVTEGLTGRTLGKAAIGALVIGNEGSPPGWLRIIVRNIFKAVILCIPALAVFSLFNPHWKGLGDIVARTVVVRPAEEQQPADRPSE